MISMDSHQWIYNLADQPDEMIYLNSADWLLAKDKHPGNDTRYLIIFKDKSLKTIRDLRKEHVPSLVEAYHKTLRFLQKLEESSSNESLPWRVFFHYYPSVFQLHAHVIRAPIHRNLDRIHDIKHVVRNLLKQTDWYKEAIILCTHSKFVHQVLNGYEPRLQSSWMRLSKSLMRIELMSRINQCDITSRGMRAPSLPSFAAALAF